MQAVPAILFVGLLAFTFVDKPNWSVPPPPRVWVREQVPQDRAFIGSIESPLKAQPGAYLLVYGWAAATSPNVRAAKVEIYIDGALAGATTDFMPRADIAGNFGRPDFGMSGWQCVVPVGDLKPGPHELQLGVLGSDGTGARVVTRSLTIVE
ncbi:MAG: hypothetical protein L0Z53_27145 [Acidobacteriales bacterium]|nr:hypothetical protein [Terriglobales bacterium]